MSVTAAPPGPPSAPPNPPPGATPPGYPPGTPPEPSRGPTAKRLLLGCVVALAFAAAGSAVVLSGEVTTLRKDLSQNPSLNVGSNQLASAGFGDPQTLLLVGDDQRALTKYYHHAVLPHSNEMLLVRLDPNKPWISMMSIPRELQVTIYPAHAPQVTTRINYAYTAGGIPLLLSTIKRVLGLSVNHVVVITFGRFKRAVDEMGCVYSTVDRRYYHANVPGGEQYQEINLLPGYQKLCGDQSLQFVSYRHGDTSLVRDARNQSFLLDVKKQYGPTLADNVHKFERIFGKAVQTDPGLHSTNGILNLLGTLISSAGRRVRQVQFQANLLASYDTASAQQISSSVHAFLYGGSSIPKQNTAALAHAVHRRKVAAKLPLVPVTAGELGQARGQAGSLPFTLEYPRVRERVGAGTPATIRVYEIHAPDGTAYPAYVTVQATGQLGQFYDVQGMSWTNAPQFASPEQIVHVAGRGYQLYYEADKLKMVAWHEHGAVYWVRNTLSNSVPDGEMLAMAEQTVSIGSRGPRTSRRGLGGVGVPTPTSPKQTTSTLETVGSVGGLLGLVLAPFLLLPLIKRRRELFELRGHVHSALHREARLSAVANAAGLPAYVAPRMGIASPSPDVAGTPWSPRSHVHARRRGRPGPLALLAAVAVIAVAGALIGVFVIGGGSGSGSGAKSSRSVRPGSAAVPPVPVAVLNATPAAGAARTLANQLHAQGVTLATVGNLGASRPPGWEILYAPGEQSDAERLAKLLSSHSPTVGPIDPTTLAAAGAAAKLVVVIA